MVNIFFEHFIICSLTFRVGRRKRPSWQSSTYQNQLMSSSACWHSRGKSGSESSPLKSSTAKSRGTKRVRNRTGRSHERADPHTTKVTLRPSALLPEVRPPDSRRRVRSMPRVRSGQPSRPRQPVREGSGGLTNKKMRTIHKYPIQIADNQNLEVPHGAAIIHVGIDPTGAPCIWADVDTDNYKVGFPVLVRGTGHPIPSGACHVGSFAQGPFVWHVFTS